ncbi:MAG TPA: heparan-alpha-glucosaminide N-acetyltransferase domain-containing protein [Chitinophagaceae bacterium]|nr:heparan-alpha-glucosaminide N-acetyltransferase domain-containing protein [Chitinophagaceae bacterium]
MRIREIDLARGMTVFIMAPVHAVLIYSTVAVHHSLLGIVLAFLAEGPGAPLFMWLMGLSYGLFSKPGSTLALTRALKLLGLAYLLNILKFLIPLSLGFIPSKLLTDYGISGGPRAYLQLFGLGDILQLAAISIIILYLIRQLPHFRIWAALLAAGVTLAAPLLWRPDSPSLIGYPGNLLWGMGPTEFFPVFPWLAFPLIGLACSEWLAVKKPIFSPFLLCGALLLVLGIGLKQVPFLAASPDFYRMGPADTLIHSGIVLVWLYLCHWCIVIVPANRIFQGVFYLSRHITQIYIIQWILVFWMLGIIGYDRLGMTSSLVCVVLINIPVFGISMAVDRIRSGWLTP